MSICFYCGNAGARTSVDGGIAHKYCLPENRRVEPIIPGSGNHGKNRRGEDHQYWRGGDSTISERTKITAKRTALRYPYKNRAREKVAYLVRTGKAPAARDCICVDCGGKAAMYDHRNGYDHPYEVEPTCFKCDGLRRRRRGEAKNVFTAPRLDDRCLLS